MVCLTTPSVPKDYTESKFRMIVANDFETKITTRPSITENLFYIHWYICQGDMFRPSRSSSGPPRKQIQELLFLGGPEVD